MPWFPGGKLDSRKEVSLFFVYLIVGMYYHSLNLTPLSVRDLDLKSFLSLRCRH